MLALCPLLLLTLSTLQATAQHAPRPQAALSGIARPETWTTVVRGQVLDPTGRPAEGAVVLTSAGGEAVCDVHGAYRLSVDVPVGARELHLAAALGAGDGRMLASTRVDLDLLPRALDVDPLTLAGGDSCSPDWLTTFGGLPGLNSKVYAMAVHDDGTGPALYVGGEFLTAAGLYAPSVARWNGAQWTSVTTQIQGIVYALAVFDDGSGAQLYAGGDFVDFVDPGAPDYIARWDGQSWKALGSGTDGPVRALAVFDSGSGPELHAGGEFFAAGGSPAQRVARWNGASWSTLGSGVGGIVHAMTVHTDSTGTALYVGGSLFQAGGVSVNNLARWSGSAWSKVGNGVNNVVYALASFDPGDGTGARLYAGGIFSATSGAVAHGLAVWNPLTSQWSAPFSLSSGSQVYALAARSSPSGSWLSVGKRNGLSNELIRWQGGADFLPAVPVGGRLYAVQHFDDGTGGGSRTYAAGDFLAVYQPSSFEQVGVGNIFVVDLDTVSTLGAGLDQAVTALAVHDDGSGTGPALFVAGLFINHAIGMAKWDGSAWVDVTPLHVYGGVRTMLSYDGPSGRELVAGGNIPSFGIVSSEHVARLVNGAWTGMGGGMNGEVRALAAWDDQGLGVDALYAGGTFTAADGLPASRLARWDGSSWAHVGGGTNGPVHALAVFDDGSGEALYVAGDFTLVASGDATNRIARWDGSSWSTVGSGMNQVVNSLCVFDDGTGPRLYAGGFFTTAGGVPASCIAAWDGTSWSPVGGGIQTNFGFSVSDLEVFDDGRGPALFVAGWFWMVDGMIAEGIARWDGSSWSPLGAGVAGTYVDDMAVLGNTLYVGGGFLVSPGGDSFLARWGGCDAGPTTCTPSLAGPETLLAAQCGTLTGAYQLASDGNLGAGTWSLGYGSGFPVFDGWSATLVNSSDASTTIEWVTGDTSTAGSFPLLLTWTGTCNGLPVEWTFDVSCNLLQACPPPPPITAYCFGDGSGAPCPCGNDGPPGGGCLNSAGLGAVLSHSGSPSVSAHDLVLTTTLAIPGKPCIYYQGTSPTGTLKKTLLSDGLLCIGGSFKKLQSVTSGIGGMSSTSTDIATKGLAQPGDTLYYQAWYRDIAQSPCGYGENRSNALEVLWLP